MKTLLILILVLALGAVAFLTRPSQENFNTYYKSQQAGTSSGLSLKGVFQNLSADSYLSAIVYHDRVLWTSITKDGQTQYVGAFSHWFKESGT